MRILEKCRDENKYNPGSTVNSQSKDYKFSLERYGITSDISWVRSAAQAALALKLHGILEKTGNQYTSTKLHHASLPKFSKVRCESDDVDESPNHVSDKVELDVDDDDFETGIICIESCLDEVRDYDSSHGTGFDVLPLPVPLHKRSALCAGSSQMKSRVIESKEKSKHKSYHDFGTAYGDSFASQEQGSITIGDVSVDRDINRLREMMRTVDKSLNSGFSAGLLIGAESSEKVNHQLDFLKEIDIDGLCPRFISQNALLNGVESLERNRNALNDSSEQFVNGK